MKHLFRVMQILLVIVILGAIYLIIQNKKEQHQEEKKYTQLQAAYNKDNIRPQFKALQTINPDIKGWIRIPSTLLNYPVLQSKDNHDYLEHNFKNEQVKKGSIFIDYRNNMKNLSKNTVIYGHHVGDGTMFDALKDYLNQDFYHQHPSIQLDTIYGKYQIQVVSAYQTTSKHNYIQTTFDNQKAYEQFLKQTVQKSVIQTTPTLTGKDQIVTLSTCKNPYSQTDQRIVVVGKLIKI